jgi:hypothetical protein
MRGVARSPATPHQLHTGGDERMAGTSWKEGDGRDTRPPWFEPPAGRGMPTMRTICLWAAR